MVLSFPNFRNNSNSDYPKSSLTFISEYPKLLTLIRQQPSPSLRARGSPQSAARRTPAKSIGEKKPMQLTWTPEHSDALREYFARGLSYSEIADAINVKFQTAYSRSATIGRARRMGLADPSRHVDLPSNWPALPPGAKTPPRLPRLQKRHVPEHVPKLIRPMPGFERAERTRLRCVEVVPRHLNLIDLEGGDCRYPYGGDEEGEAITFCGHPRRRGSSYCAPHFYLTRGPGVASERAAGAVSLRLVKAA
jgi:GcrA cell cycle regulator